MPVADELRIRVEDLLILGRPPLGESRPKGLFVGPDGFEGWEDGGGDARRDAVDIPNGHGEFDSPVYLGARVVSVDGWALAPTPGELGHLRSRVMGLGATGDRFQLTVDQYGVSSWAMARRGGKPSFKDAGIRSGLHRASFQLQFVCVDPRRYGDENVFGPGTAPLAWHFGNFPAAPVLEVTGNMPSGYTVVAAARSFVVSQALTSGQTHRIDMRTGQLFRNGVLQVGAVSQANLWTIPPGARYSHTLTPVSGSGQVKVIVLDTFV